MPIEGPSEKTVRARPESGFLGFLQALALLAALAGAVGSVALMLHAGRSTPGLLRIAFVFWVLSPFVPLAWANLVSKRWPVLTRTSLYCLTLLIALGALAFYGKVILPPAGTARAFAFVAVPPASWLLIAIVLPTAAFISRRQADRRAGV